MMRRTMAMLLVFASVAVVPACASSDAADDEADEDETGQAYTIEGECDGLPRLKHVQTPPGVCVGLVKDKLNFTRGIAQLKNGDLIVIEMGGWAVDKGGAWLLRRQANKKFAKVRVLAQIDKPSGVAIGPDGLVYVGTPVNVFRFDPYETVPKTGALPATVHQPRLSVVIKDLPGDGRHPLKKMVFDKREPWSLYVNIGSKTDVCEQGASASPPAGFPLPCTESAGRNARGSIRKYALDAPGHVASGFTLVAHGLRNSMALAVHPTSNLLVQGENSRDSINKVEASLDGVEGELPHEELNVIEAGKNYGWPYCYDNGVPNPEYRGRVDCSNYQKPALLLPGHAAPLGMAYYTGSLFPAPYRGNLLVTFHGYREHGHRLVLVPVDEKGAPGAGEPLDIVRRWGETSDGLNPLGAPVDVMVAQDGSIYVTEDKNGDVLRVFFDAHAGNGAPMKPLPPSAPVVSDDERQRCAALAGDHSLFADVERNVIDTSCASCHGAGPGFPGGLALYKCDAAGNARRLTKARAGGAPAYAVPRDENSELVRRLKGDGYPQMPAGGVKESQMDSVLAWIRAGAPVP